MRFRELERIVLDDGWFLNDVRGSHHQYKHPTKSGKVTIPNHSCEFYFKASRVKIVKGNP